MLPWWLPLLICVPLFSVLISLAFSGNLLVIAAIFYDRKLRRQPENLFLVSLALSDLFVAGMVMVLAAANDLIGFWPFGAAFCQFWICLDIACSTASILNLCAIALDRFIHISRPMRYVRFVGRRVICCSVCAIWIISTAVGTAQIAFGATNGLEIYSVIFNGDYFGEINETDKFRFIEQQPTLVQCQLQLSPFYAVFSSLLSFFLPATLMLFLYYRLYLYARHHARSIQSQLKQATSLLILQLASDRVRQVVVRPSTGFLSPSSIALHYDSRRFSGKSSFDGESLQKAEFSQINVAVNKSPENHSIDATIQQGTPVLRATLRQLRRTESNNSSSFSFVSRNGLGRRKSCSPLPSPTTKRGFKSCSWNNNNGNGGHRSSDKKARVTLGVIMGCSIFQRVTFQSSCMNIFVCQSNGFDRLIDSKTVSWLGYANSSVNPVIYGIFNRDFRRAFSRIMNKLIHCIDEERRGGNSRGGTFRTRTESESFNKFNKSLNNANLKESCNINQKRANPCW
uniref:G-protein coupled receptors family 1 profile domain-containing protein n=1 Tax=Meloidogyne floridensis TaxID=298350 RepID=A0A915PAS0_9BILA